MVNLCVLLSGSTKDTNASLPSNVDAEAALATSASLPERVSNTREIELGKYYVTLMLEGNLDTWYIASCEQINTDGTYKMNHLMRTDRQSDLKWRHPPTQDCLDLHRSSIVDCNVCGEWDISQQRNMTFLLQNHEKISSTVQQISLFNNVYAS